MERTASDFVEDMLRRGLKWTAILAVASSARHGRWYDETKVILQGKGVMPTDPKMINEIRAADAEEARRKQLDKPQSAYRAPMTSDQRAAIRAKYGKNPPAKATEKPPIKTVNRCDFS